MSASGALAAWAALAALALGQQPGGVQVTVVRSYRSAGSVTLVDGFCRVPVSLVSALGVGAGRRAAYRVAVSVRDTAGAELTSQGWSQIVPGRMVGMAGASLGEHFAFAVRPGRYTVEVAVTDSATGRVSRQQFALTAFAEPPGASDLLLADGLRLARGPQDTLRRPGEVRKGDAFIETSGRPVLTPQRSSLGYYLELYAQQPETVSVVARVRSAGGAQIVETAPQRLPLGTGGGVTRGVLDLGGLPPGEYRLDVTATLGGREVSRSAEFGMSGVETEAAIASAAAPAEAADRFTGLSEAQLDSLYGPLIYLMSGEDQGLYPPLTVDGKRRFLRRFWAQRDPTAGTARNEEEERFYAAIAEANRRYHEGGAAEIPGWRTDRGRIFIRYGPPDEILQRPQAGSTAPYEVWKYTKTRARKFVFYDATRFGNYALVWTNERRESSRPNWRDLLGPEAVEDVERF